MKFKIYRRCGVWFCESPRGFLHPEDTFQDAIRCMDMLINFLSDND